MKQVYGEIVYVQMGGHLTRVQFSFCAICTGAVLLMQKKEYAVILSFKTFWKINVETLLFMCIALSLLRMVRLCSGKQK